MEHKTFAYNISTKIEDSSISLVFLKYDHNKQQGQWQSDDVYATGGSGSCTSNPYCASDCEASEYGCNEIPTFPTVNDQICDSGDIPPV